SLTLGDLDGVALAAALVIAGFSLTLGDLDGVTFAAALVITRFSLPFGDQDQLALVAVLRGLRLLRRQNAMADHQSRSGCRPSQSVVHSHYLHLLHFARGSSAPGRPY